VLAPSFVMSYSHSDADIDRTLVAIDGALEVYARGLAGDPMSLLTGRPSRTVFERRRF
jgi:glutamate-1-semialdehyde 2,1-aminomutase